MTDDDIRADLALLLRLLGCHSVAGTSAAPTSAVLVLALVAGGWD